TLDAARDVLLLGAANTQKTDGSNSSSGGSVGVSLGFGSSGGGLSIFANANKGQGNEHGDGTFWTETQVDTGGTLSLHSGRDTSLVGAQAGGETVKVDVGRDLLLQSQQDSDNYDAKQTSTSGGVSVAVVGGGGSANLSMSKDKLHSNYDSVQEQTGIFAGKGGFDITVGEHTQLDGAVIASTADKSKNSLDTGTLGFSDIENKADFKAEHQGGSLSTGGPVGSDLLSNLGGVVLSGLSNDGHAEGTTQSAIADGTITLRDQDKQQQNVEDLSRDTENANGSIGPIFDKEKEQNRLREAQLIGEIGGQAMDIARTQGKIIATNAANEKMKDVRPEDITAAKEQWEKANPGKVATAEDINNQIYQTAYNQAFNESGLGTGGSVQRAMQAATAAIQGLAGGNMAQALTGASAPYLAEVIKAGTGDNQAANAMAHAVLGAVTAYASGNNALAGAAGAATAELMAPVIIAAMGWDKNTLSEDQKQTVSALATLAAGLAGGLTGDSTADTVAGAQTGKNAVENNALREIIDQNVSGVSQAEKYQNAQKELVAAVEEFKAHNCAGISAEACSAKMQANSDELLKGFTGFGIDFVPIIGDIKSLAEAQSALDYLIATIGFIPGAGDIAGKAIKAAEAALKKGDLAEASRLINEGSQQVSSKAKDVQIWSETKKNDPVSNAYGHWDKHKQEFPELQNSKQYVEAAHDFVNNPPPGTLVKVRPNGETVYYNPATNTFAVKRTDNVPRTMFKPNPADHGYETNLDYFNAQ
ncbi:hemagglutinin repeat-containing protein, partial [Yersinia hibernica]